MIDLSILIASYETSVFLERCLASIEKAREDGLPLDLQVIVVDNGSRDRSLEVARASKLEPRVVALRTNRGFACAMNRGLRLATGRHVLLLNSDARVDRGLLEGAVALLDADAQIGVLGPALLHPGGRPQRSAHSLPSFMDEFIPEPLRRRAFRERRVDGDPARVAEARDVEAVRGAVFFVNGTVLAKVGPLDERYFFFLEETDYCARVVHAGHRVVYAPSLTAHHALGASSKERAPLATRIEYHRSLYRFLERAEGAHRMRLARVARVSRNVLVLPLLAVAAVVSRDARSRLSQRAGLLLWHLRGCPADPDLAVSLRLLGNSPLRPRRSGET